VKKYRLETTRAVELEVEAAFEWYEREQTGLGFEFLGELRAAYRRIVDNPLAYQILRSGIRRTRHKSHPEGARSAPALFSTLNPTPFTHSLEVRPLPHPSPEQV
jgi:plasmid stabilization system protein ParE